MSNPMPVHLILQINAKHNGKNDFRMVDMGTPTSLILHSAVLTFNPFTNEVTIVVKPYEDLVEVVNCGRSGAYYIEIVPNWREGI